MLRLSVSDDHLRATFRCEFCGKEYKWPFPARTLWKGQPNEQSYPDGRHVVLSHFIGDSNLTKFGFPECPQRAKWTNTAWERYDEDAAAVRQSGSVTMINGWPLIK